MEAAHQTKTFQTIDELFRALQELKYICDRRLATTVFLALGMEKPLLLEGEPGVGKTEVAKVLAQALGRRLIRLQCYEGLDVSTAIYEWNFTKQILSIKMAEASHSLENLKSIFDEEYLIQRPLLEAIRSETLGRPVVLLIDELDRADEEFEAFLLEVLSDYQITVPEIGTLTARSKPVVVITSNRTRELHDAIKRRCLYHWIPYPSLEKEYAVITAKVPEIGKELAMKVCSLMQEIRGIDFFKRPGIAETLDWVRSLILLHRDHLDAETIEETLGCLFKVQEDQEKVESEKLAATWAGE
ncbi:MAG: MoxR family ATPase [Deltaproteobacteria bacterium]|nr:MoxR family ATPase [Deltaproteobacteria bacterium]